MILSLIILKFIISVFTLLIILVLGGIGDFYGKYDEKVKNVAVLLMMSIVLAIGVVLFISL